MRRRKKYGYILLASLIISGLAGTPTDFSLTEKERKFAAEHLKQTKADLLNSIDGLTESQINYRPKTDQTTIKEYVYQMVSTEINMWSRLPEIMKTLPNPEKRTAITLSDQQVIDKIEDGDFELGTTELLKSRNAEYSSLKEAISDFMTTRLSQIKYLKSTTEDLRNRVISTSLAAIDSYQYCLYISALSYRYIKLINEIKADPDFPKN